MGCWGTLVSSWSASLELQVLNRNSKLKGFDAEVGGLGG